MSPHVVKPPTVHWLVLAEEVSAVAAVNAMPSLTGKTSTLHITTPVRTLCVEQIKRLLSASMCGQSAINTAEAGNSIVQTGAVSVAQNTFRLYIIIGLLIFRVWPRAQLRILNIWKPESGRQHRLEIMQNMCKHNLFAKTY